MAYTQPKRFGLMQVRLRRLQHHHTTDRLSLLSAQSLLLDAGSYKWKHSNEQIFQADTL